MWSIGVILSPWRSEFNAKWSFSQGEYNESLNGEFRPAPVLPGRPAKGDYAAELAL
jgi:hypothetical protein